MQMPITMSVLVAILATASTGETTENEVIESLIQAYSTEGAESKSYFSAQGKEMFEQVSMLDSMALAKRGKVLEARDQLVSLATHSILGDLPIEYQAAGDLMKLMESNRPFFKNTISAVQTNLNVVSDGIKQKLSEFQRSGSKTDDEKRKVQQEIKTSVADQDASRQHIFDAWKDDFNRLKRLAEASRPSPKEVKAWHVYGKAKFFVKRLKFPPTSSLKFIGPVSDILGIVVSGIGLYDAIKNQNTMGIVNSVLGIVGSVVALSLFTTALVTGIQVLSTISALAGVAFFIAPLLVQLFWPSNLAIETANKLTEISQKDLQGYLHQLGKFSESGSRSFGWMYQVNSGVLVEKQIQPDTPIKFSQPSCAVPDSTPCDPNKASYKGKSYLVAGHQRKSSYTEHEFVLELPYDFMGVPTEPKFCGNTINVNTVSFRQYIEFLGRKYRRSRHRLVGNYQRNLEIDTRTVPQYNDADLNQFRANDQAVKQRKRSLLDETQEIKCEPESDRISIDELAQLSPRSGKVTINTGAGKDVLSINSMVGKMESTYNKEDYLVADLGADGNMLSMGAALGVEQTRESLVAGVVFDNTGGAGRVCFLKGDFKSMRCVGTVKQVTIFKGSRLHDKVVLGSRGPFAVIQNSGANQYVIAMPDILAGKTTGTPTRFEIMDISGNRPLIKIRQGDQRVTYEVNDSDVIKLKTRDGDVVVEIRITGYVTEVDIIDG